MKPIYLVSLLASLCLIPVVAKATPVTYDFTVTSCALSATGLPGSPCPAAPGSPYGAGGTFATLTVQNVPESNSFTYTSFPPPPIITGNTDFSLDVLAGPWILDPTAGTISCPFQGICQWQVDYSATQDSLFINIQFGSDDNSLRLNNVMANIFPEPGCFVFNEACLITGYWSVVSVPEPSTAMILPLPLALVGLLLWRCSQRRVWYFVGQKMGGADG